jgi:[ribosomal protein S5]-alanine N-acetyltransferase
MRKLPTITLERIILRPFTEADAPTVQILAGDRYVAETTLYIPHPYEDGEAEKWISTHQRDYQSKGAITLAIADKEEKHLMGAISLGINRTYEHGEIAYWVGKPFSGKGYCTEAAKGLIRYGFEQENLNRVYARYMDNNPASGKVMKKIGMQYEGTLRQHVKKWGEYYDLFHYGILKSEFELEK